MLSSAFLVLFVLQMPLYYNDIMSIPFLRETIAEANRDIKLRQVLLICNFWQSLFSTKQAAFVILFAGDNYKRESLLILFREQKIDNISPLLQRPK